MYLITSIVLFGLVALVHLFIVSKDLQLQIERWDFPMWWPYLVLVISAVMAGWGIASYH